MIMRFLEPLPKRYTSIGRFCADHPMMISLSAEIGVRDGSDVGGFVGVEVRTTFVLGCVEDEVGGVGVHVEGRSMKVNGALSAVAGTGGGGTAGSIGPEV
jgi:hypothetical protein